MKKMHRRKRLALFALTLIAGIIIINVITREIRDSVWDGVGHINIAVDNGDLEIWSIEPSKKQVFHLKIPQNMYLDIPSYGLYRASAVGKLSLLERKDGTLVTGGLSQTLAVPIDAVLVRKEGKQDIFNLTDIFGFQQVSGRITNFTSLDLVRLWFFLLSVKKDSIETINLTDLDAVSKEVLPDQTERLRVDANRFSKIAKKYFTDSSLEKEGLTIEIINGTLEEGTANSLALLLTNIGGTVINTSKGEKRQQSEIFTKSQGYTALKIAQIINGKISHSLPKDSRADILVILGGDK